MTHEIVQRLKYQNYRRFFKKIQRNKGRNIRNNPDVEAVLKDMSTNLNLPVVIRTKGDDSFEVTNKTIMRKKDFRTTSKVINYEKWSDKYKKSIDCDNPKGFSQRGSLLSREKKMINWIKNRMKERTSWDGAVCVGLGLIFYS